MHTGKNTPLPSVSRQLDILQQDTKDQLNEITQQFSNRRKRGIMSYLGVMDSDDWTRIDENLDAVRANEEAQKQRLQIQSGLVKSIFEDVKNASLTINKQLATLSSDLKVEQEKFKSGIESINNITEVTRHERELVNLGQRIMFISKRVEKRLNIILELVIGTKLQVTEWWIPFEPEMLE